MHEGLSSYNHPMAMIPSFVTGVPNGTETGTFLALDLGGTNLRVCEVVLHGDHTFTLRQQKYKVSEALKTGESSALFEYLADSVDAFLTESDSESNKRPATPGIPASLASSLLDSANSYFAPEPTVVHLHLGLTFSFPVEQSSLDSGTLLTWTKGFSAKNSVGKDVVQMLQGAMDKKHMHVRCVALVNDTVGAMLSRAYQTGGCLLGAIFGTGTNGAYLEDVKNITKLGNSPAAAAGGKMVVNTEWGAFDSKRLYLPSTTFDYKLDRESINPREHAYEKFISGMYLGEITRNALISLIDAAPHPLLFNGYATKAMNTHYAFDTAVMSAVENAWEGTDPNSKSADREGAAEDGVDAADVEGNMWAEGWEASLSDRARLKLERVRDTVASNLGYDASAVSLRDAAIVRRICSAVAKRAALLSGVAIAAVIVQTGNGVLRDESSTNGDLTNGDAAHQEKIPVGVDGSLVEFYPGFEVGLRTTLRGLLGEHTEKRVVIGMAKDGSGVGAALCALQAAKQTGSHRVHAPKPRHVEFGMSSIH
ncbi:hypothetical protein PLICRDRAFT_34922 [Plicaturopsis crispa FD-325 SS-3]|nr:hypothetical protein PLICRDRAFT_34922 [Plicaturopsis crispa FD-325 SS-3]